MKHLAALFIAFCFFMPAARAQQQVLPCVSNFNSTTGATGCKNVSGSFGLPVLNSANTYNTIAASQTAQVLSSANGGTTGATGDYLSHCVVIPASTSPGVVTIYDNSTAVYSFPGGASSLSNLIPFSIPVGAVSTSGAWKITTGANLSVVCTGHFT